MARDEFFRPGQDYRDKGTPKAPDDQFMGWINLPGSGMPNSPGIRPLRYLSRRPFTDLPALLVLVTKKSTQGGGYNPWEDAIDLDRGTVIYWGDAKLEPGKRYTDFSGNQTLEKIWEAAKAGRRDELPPILHFVKYKSGWVTFSGLCEMTALWPDRFEEKGQLVDNYRCRLRILGSESVPVAWLHARREATTALEALRGAPELWSAWIQGSRPPSPVSLDAEALAVPWAAEVSRSSGQGFSSDIRKRKAVELHAMKRAREYFQERGFTLIEDVSSKRPFDLHARDEEREIFIEVKGTETAGSSVFLTRNEVEFARRNASKMVLYVLHSIQVRDVDGEPLAEDGVHTVFWPWNVDTGVLAPTQFTYELP